MNLIPATNSIIVIIDENWEGTLTRPTFYKYTYLHNGMRQQWPDLICPLSFENPLNNYDGWKDSQHLLKRLAPTQRDCGLDNLGHMKALAVPSCTAAFMRQAPCYHCIAGLIKRYIKLASHGPELPVQSCCPAPAREPRGSYLFWVDSGDRNTKKMKGENHHSAPIPGSQVHSGSRMLIVFTPALLCPRAGAASGTVAITELYSLHQQ